MSQILVSGLINIETTLRVNGFPIHYNPVNYPFYGVDETVSGVGYNISKALTILGNEVEFLSLIGRDMAERQVRAALRMDGIQDAYIISNLEKTARSVILYDLEGRRQIHVDLKDIQEQIYPPALFNQAMQDCDLLSLCNINFSRPMLKAARREGKIIATDVHTIRALDDAYNQEFMQAAQILFMSDEGLPTTPEAWAKQVIQAYGNEILVIGLGAQGALLSVRSDNFLERVPAVQTRPVVNTIGAGDALFSAFLHAYAQTGDPYEAIQKAVVFASYKIGEKGAAEGFLGHQALEDLYSSVGV